ncbi:SphA family protein [Modicisalibacter xianhensis]|nr:transporter [Halomonas xianhensis]
MVLSRLGIALASAVSGNTALAANGHYVPGVEGLGGPVLPPPGFYYRGYAVNYDIDSLRDEQGQAIPGENSGTVNALVSRFVWVTDKTVVGANYGVEAIIPVLETDLAFDGVGLSDDDSGIGDIYLGPIVLGWHGPQWDAVFAAGMWFDTAQFSQDEPASVGKGHRTTMLTLGGTWHLDEARRWSLSALARYEVKTEQNETGITPGDSWLVEWGLGRRFANGVELGLVGYDAWQLESDKGTPAALADNKAEVHAFGIEAGRFWPQLGVGLKAAYYNEYESENDTRGDMLRLQLTKAF